jgi:hypothetical protein
MAYRIPNQHPLDLNQRVAVGVAIPFSSAGVFRSTYTTTEQIKSNIINYVLTNTGERVLNPNFGANLRAQLFEQITPNTLNLYHHKDLQIEDCLDSFPSKKKEFLILYRVFLSLLVPKRT